jgi:lysophospholipid acyltransferase (LPLAT)-like uncharacterized protein
MQAVDVKEESENRPSMARTSFLKRFAASDFGGRLISFLAGLYVRLVDLTSSWRFVGLEKVEPMLDAPPGLLVAFWHQRLMMSPLMRRKTKKRVFMLISSHRDGEIIANAVEGYGLDFIRGSSPDPKKKWKEKGGAPALARMIAAVEDGHVVAVTPDGPLGPARRAQAGVIRLAQMSGAPIVPVAYSVSRGPQLKTWDRFLLAAPFSKGCIAISDPIHVPADATPERIEEARRALEAALNAVTALADAETGRSPDGAGLG